MHRLGPQNFCLYAAILTTLLSIYVLIATQPLLVRCNGKLSPNRTLGLAVVLGVLSGAAAYGISSATLRCCP